MVSDKEKSNKSEQPSESPRVKVGDVVIGRGLPVVVQSMTSTPTTQIAATVQEIIELHAAGSQLVRLTVNNEAAAAAVPRIREQLDKLNCFVPLVGCFHYNGHQLLSAFPECASTLAKYRINPGNVGFGEKRDKHFEEIINLALKHNKPIRIGVNWGSLDKTILTQLMEDNARRSTPLSDQEVLREAVIVSALSSARSAEQLGMSADMLVVSAKVSRVDDLVAIYRQLHARSPYALHLGLTEAGMGSRAATATVAALSILLHDGIGDTIRASLTPRPGEPRSAEVKLCLEILQSLGLRHFAPTVTACPGCGRTNSDYFRQLAASVESMIERKMPEWRTTYPEVVQLRIAVMGCIVNGPGESKHADIGISLPGDGENPVAPVFIDGEKRYTLRGDNITAEFSILIEEYIKNRYQSQIFNGNTITYND